MQVLRDAWNGALKLNYREYFDDWGIRAHTGEVDLLQRLFGVVQLRASYRRHWQTGARFFTTSADPALTDDLRTARMKQPTRLSRASFRDSYWTVAQMVAHQSSNGCNLQPGDLLASGTLSGTSGDSLGSLMELTLAGKNPLSLPRGETRAFLEDGDEVIERGRCARDGYATIGFGEAAGRIQPALVQ